MNKSLKQIVNGHLEGISLSVDQLNELETLVGADSEKKIHTRSRSNWMYAAVAAAFVMAFIVSTIYIDQPADMPLRIAEEVVHNHFKLKPLEVKTSSISDVRRYFSKLDFMLLNSTLLKDADLSLIGGRYCSLQGITAAQLRVKGGRNNIVQTFYQAEYRKDVFGKLPDIEQGEKPVEVYVKGIKVKIWVEKGLVFALTEAPS